jgi:hypothetical protein
MPAIRRRLGFEKLADALELFLDTASCRSVSQDDHRLVAAFSLLVVHTCLLWSNPAV